MAHRDEAVKARLEALDLDLERLRSELRQVPRPAFEPPRTMRKNPALWPDSKIEEVARHNAEARELLAEMEPGPARDLEERSIVAEEKLNDIARERAAGRRVVADDDPECAALFEESMKARWEASNIHMKESQARMAELLAQIPQPRTPGPDDDDYFEPALHGRRLKAVARRLNSLVDRLNIYAPIKMIAEEDLERGATEPAPRVSEFRAILVRAKELLDRRLREDDGESPELLAISVKEFDNYVNIVGILEAHDAAGSPRDRALARRLAEAFVRGAELARETQTTLTRLMGVPDHGMLTHPFFSRFP